MENHLENPIPKPCKGKAVCGKLKRLRVNRYNIFHNRRLK